MAFRFYKQERLRCGVRRIASEQVARALAEIDDGQLPREKTVHQVRKRCKKLRGVLRLIRPGMGKRYRREDALLRDAAGLLSGTRDLDVMLNTYEGLRTAADCGDDSTAFHDYVDSLRRERAVATATEQERLTEFRHRMVALTDRIETWPVPAGGKKSVAAGFARIYDKARRNMKAAYQRPNPERFHEWRKQGKYHWYHLQLMRRLWPRVMKALASDASELSSLLGADHDLAVLIAHLPQAPLSATQREALLVAADARRTQLQSTARALGDRMFLAKPAVWEDLVRQLWKQTA